MKPVIRLFALLLLTVVGLFAPAISSIHPLRAEETRAGEEGRPDVKVTYDVSLARRAQNIYGITMRLEGLTGAHLTLALPAWNALYQIRDFSQNLRRLRVRDEAGQALPFVLLDKQTWRIDLNGRRAVEITYDILANAPGSFNSEINGEHAFFNGANLFLYVVGRPDLPASLRLSDVPPAWRVATALARPSPVETVFAAQDYDQLVDSPVEIGSFESLQFPSRGAMFHVAIHGPPESYKAAAWLEVIKKIVEYQMDLMNDAPFKNYTFIYHIGLRAGGGMEHRNSTAIGLSESSIENRLDGLAGVTAHEFFHLWNVKRIRPRAFDRIDYSREVYTRALWFSEGCTSYVASLTLLRSGLIDREKFYSHMAGEIETLQNRPGRLLQSVEEASWFTWFDKYPSFRSADNSISYYNKGLVLGFLIDLRLRAATGGRRSLDDVFRFMNEWFAKAPIGFEEHEILRTLNALSGYDFSAFYNDYIRGTAEIPYNEILALAGLTLETKEIPTPDAGFRAKRPFGQYDRPLQITHVNSGSPAEKAGLHVGDDLVGHEGLTFGDREEDETPNVTIKNSVHLKVNRQGRSIDITFTPQVSKRVQYTLHETPSPTPAQLTVRHGLLTGSKRLQ